MTFEQEKAMLKSNYIKVKRIYDFIIALLFLAFLLPFFLVIGIIIKLDSPGPVFFKQSRIGYESKPFIIYKFRSMHTATPAYIPTSDLSAPEEHLTRFGKFLRKSSIDELPQLINILKNEMSLIGPRPVIAIEKELIDLRKQLGADQILPGVTGLAQINGRDNLEFSEKARLDAAYVSKMSLQMDLSIILKTLLKIVRSEHISH